MSRGSSVSVRRQRCARPLIGGVGVLVLILTACGPRADQPPLQAYPSPQSTTPAAAPSPAQATPSNEPADAAALETFTAVTARIWASDARDRGRAYVDALERAGFARESMQVTADRSTVGYPAESLQFSVAWSDTACLVGQVGPSTGQPVTALMPRLADGACLAGRTRPIDW
ncbi:hypothetical protein AB0N64_13365 [Microbacterium sp. NPDC089318]